MLQVMYEVNLARGDQGFDRLDPAVEGRLVERHGARAAWGVGVELSGFKHQVDDADALFQQAMWRGFHML